jgi:hypothetical protein
LLGVLLCRSKQLILNQRKAEMKGLSSQKTRRVAQGISPMKAACSSLIIVQLCHAAVKSLVFSGRGLCGPGDLKLMILSSCLSLLSAGIIGVHYRALA